MARQGAAAYVQLYVQCSEAVAQARNAQRLPSRQVPPAVISRMCQALEVPDASQFPWEAPTVVWDAASGGVTCSGDFSSSRVDADHPTSAQQLWEVIHEAWGGPAPPPEDPAAEAHRLQAARAATAANLVHQLDLRLRAHVSRTMQELARSSQGLQGSAKQAARQKASALGRELAYERKRTIQELGKALQAQSALGGSGDGYRAMSAEAQVAEAEALFSNACKQLQQRQ